MVTDAQQKRKMVSGGKYTNITALHYVGGTTLHAHFTQ
jgi:hypothetical protein